jgi:hypothetical protein
MHPRPNRQVKLCVSAVLSAVALLAQPAPKVTSPQQAFGFNIGDDYQLVNYTRMEAYWKKLAGESDRMKLEPMGQTAEGRTQYMAIITSPANMQKLDRYKEIARRLALAQGLTDSEARALAREGKAVVWIDGGLHATETVGAQQLIEMVYQMVSRTDEETMRFLNDAILLCVPANPDGQELVSDWYTREPDPLKRSLANLPRLYQKYIGHDDNRDSYMSNMPETTNINRVMFQEWFPQIMYNHHQTGPAGTVIFMPPFRDPFNYNFDPLVPLGVELVATAMHSRLVAEGKGGSVMRSGAQYSTWWNGGLRTEAYFHNIIGILTEIIGNPTPIDIALVPDKQLPKGDWPLPIAPQKWHYRQSIDYSITNNRAILDIASRYRETWLYNIYQMGRNAIDKGSRDTWTITPKRIAALEAKSGAAPGGRGQTGPSSRSVPSDLYQTVLHDPTARDPRGYIIPSSQVDFPTAVAFVNTLLKNGVTVLRAGAAFKVGDQSYPAGSLVVKTAQAFRAHVMDMFEPQDHPNDFQYPGGPPNPPYDIAGWTLAYQMGVKFDRILDAFDGPFEKVNGLMKPPEAQVSLATGPAGYILSHQINNSFIVVNRLLKAGCDVYWLAAPAGPDPAPGAIWVPASAKAAGIVTAAAKELGVPAQAKAQVPSGNALKLKPVRIGLYDQYGGLAPSGWTRWLLEQFEFPFEVVYPATLDAGDLNAKFDALIFTDGAYNDGRGSMRAGPDPSSIPQEFRGWLGRISQEITIPQLKKFAEKGGTIVTIGGSSRMGALLGLPVKNHLVEFGSDGRERTLPREKFYIPGSLLQVDIDNAEPVAYGMPGKADVFFDDSPVFRLEPSAKLANTSPVGWFTGPEPLRSGWAWGQQFLDGGTAFVDSALGSGRVVLLGPEVAFRGQPYGTFKLLFNSLYYGSAQAAVLR